MAGRFEKMKGTLNLVKISILFFILVFSMSACGEQQEQKAEIPEDEVIELLDQDCKIPVWLPTKLNQFVEGSLYFSVDADESGYDIEMYSSKEPVIINDEADYIKKNNEPLAEAYYFASIWGKTGVLSETLSQTSNSENDWTSQQMDQGWTFFFNGSENSDLVGKIQEAFRNNPPKFSEPGFVEIIEANKITIITTWGDSEHIYSFKATCNIDDYLCLLNSFEEI